MSPPCELTVAELSRLVASALRGVPRTVIVRGQIVDRMPVSLAEGDTVVVHGRISWYGARGDIQVVAEAVSVVLI